MTPAGALGQRLRTALADPGRWSGGTSPPWSSGWAIPPRSAARSLLLRPRIKYHRLEMNFGRGALVPNLFVVGFSKSGTSDLQRFLGQHPDVFMSRPQEPNRCGKDFHAISNRISVRRAALPDEAGGTRSAGAPPER